MSSTDPIKEIQSDEIDLRDLFTKMGRTLSRWFKAIGSAILYTIVFLLKNYFALISSIIIGVGISYAIKWSTKPFYVSEMTVRSNTIPTPEMISNINQLEILIKEKNLKGLATALSITPEEALKINLIKACWVIDQNNDSIPDFVDYRNSHNVYDSVNVRMEDRFVILVESGDVTDFPGIKDKIFSFVNNNPVFRQRNDFRLKMTDELLARLNYDIKQLDSLQKVKYFEETRNMKPDKGGQMIFVQEHATQLVYDDIYNLYARKQELDQQKNLYNDLLTVIIDFYLPYKRHNGGWYYGKIIIPVCFTLMIIFLILRKNRNHIKVILSKY